MTFTVTTDLTDVDTAESTGAWTSGSLDPDKFVQGSNSIGWYAAKNGRQVNGVSSKSINWAAGDHLYFWASCDVASKLEAQTTGTTTASGLTVRVTLANGDHREWHVAGSDTWDGGWRCFVVDLGHTGTHLYSSSGTFPDTSNITDIDFYYDLSNSGNIRNVPANTYQDVIRVGTGLTAYNTSAADASFDFLDIAADDALTANRYGILEIKDGVIFAQGRVTIGDSGTNHCDFDSQDEVFVFSLRDGTDGFGLVSDDLYEINFEGNATASDQEVNFGVKVGTGDTATGRSGTLMLAGASAVRWKMNWDDSDIHTFTMYGSSVRGAFDGLGVIGVQAGTPVTTHEIAGTTFDACGQLDLQDAVCRNIIVLNSQETGSTVAALLWDEADSDVKNSLFVNNTNAIEVTTLTGDLAFTGMSFSGNTFDVRYEGASSYDLNWSGGTSPSIQNAGAGTLTAVNSVSSTFTPIENGSAFTITRDSDNAVLIDIASVTGGQAVYSYDAGNAGTATTVHIIKVGEEPIDFPYTLSAASQTVPVSQVTDRVFNNP